MKKDIFSRINNNSSRNSKRRGLCADGNDYRGGSELPTDKFYRAIKKIDPQLTNSREVYLNACDYNSLKEK